LGKRALCAKQQKLRSRPGNFRQNVMPAAFATLLLRLQHLVQLQNLADAVALAAAGAVAPANMFAATRRPLQRVLLLPKRLRLPLWHAPLSSG